MIISAIDIGTNSIRYMTARVTRNEINVTEQGGKITRIGKNVDKSGMISPVAAKRSMLTLKQFARRCRNLGSRQITIAATSALRDASNGKAFIDAAEKKLGLPVRIIEGEEEGNLALLGVSHSLDIKGKSLVIDIGGGSTELIFADGKKIEILSLNIGAVRLTERFLYEDPPKCSEYKKMDSYIARFLRKKIPRSPIKSNISSLIGAGGTVTTLAAIKLMLSKYCHEKVHGSALYEKEIAGILTLLQFMTLEDRKKVVGLKPERADIIAAGIYILKNIMELFGFYELTVSDRGILYGMIVKEAQLSN